MEQDYSHLVGKEVQDAVNERVLIVAGIDPDIGITLEEKDSPGHYPACLVHPQIHAQRHGWDVSQVRGTEPHFRESFRHWVEAIEAGVFTQAWLDVDRAIDNKHDCGHPAILDAMPRSNMCPFK